MADRYCDNGPYCLAVYAAVFDDGLPDCFTFRAARDLGPCRVLLSLATLANGSATWGMRLMAIELRERGGGPFTGSTALMHTLGSTLRFAFPLIQAISVLFMAMDNQGQGLTDMVLGTAMLNRAAP